MKSRLLAAVAIGAVFLVAPASAQVKIGILNDQSRVYADSGGKYSLEAARMAVEDFGGEVLGQKIEIVTADHQNKPDLATAIARRWYDTEGVDMITELTTSIRSQNSWSFSRSAVDGPASTSAGRAWSV
jgi:branched-chain amino acid transport system substrate-binding protein